MSETKAATEAIEHEKPDSKSAPCSSHCSTVCECQWTLSGGLDVNIHKSDMDDCHVGLSFIQYNGMFKADLTIEDALTIRDELTRIATDVFREDKTIRCPACGYTWEDAGIHGDHRVCRRYPFFPDERGKSQAINR